MMLSKKAQTTIFIIIGIIILLAGGLLFYFNTIQSEIEIAPGVYITSEKIPTEFNPIKEYVTNCLQKTATEAVQKISNGGYIDDIEVSNAAFVVSQNPTESQAVQFSQNSELKIPYWHYLKSINKCDKCEFSQNIPDLTDTDGSIQDQINRYVAKNLPSCMDFSSFDGFSVSPGEPTLKTTIAEKELVVVADYPIAVQSGEISSTMSQFYVTLPVNLRRIYNLAHELTRLESENSYLEKDVLNLIVGFSSVDEKKLPPMADTQIEFGGSTTWSKSKVKEEIKLMLTSYIQYLQVYNTENYRPIDAQSKMEDSLYNRGMTIPMDEKYNDLSVSYNYLDFWPIYFDLNCRGDSCKPESAASFLMIPMGINRYNFVYDVSFPVLVGVTDKKAFNSQGYTFNFFLEGNIRNNEPLSTGALIKGLAVSDESMFCDEDKRNSGEIKIEAKDGKGTPLDGVQVLFDCAGESCMVGKTEYGASSQKFPICAGGTVSYMKEGYLTRFENIDTSLENKNALKVTLEPMRKKIVKVMKKKMIKTDNGWEFFNLPVDLGDNEEAWVFLVREGSAKEGEFKTGFQYRRNETSEIEILPGKYKVDIQGRLLDKLIIPARDEEVGSWLSKETIHYPAQSFDESNPFPFGGLSLELTIGEDGLDSHDTLIFNMVSIELKSVPESERTFKDMQQTEKIEEYSKSYALFLKPRYE